jgi:hypothetical protein
MTCYFRHLTEFFEKAGIQITPKNKREIDRVIHEVVDVAYKNCSASWKQVKDRITEDEASFILMLKEKWNNR